MSLRSTFLLPLLILLMLSGLTRACLADESENDIYASSVLRNRYPNYTFDKVVKTEVPGVFLVYGKRNIIYFVPESGHIIIGDIWSPQGKNISEEPRKKVLAKASAEREETMSKALEGLDLSKAVVVGDGPKKVVEITDPDCPHCKTVSAWLSKRDDVTRYIYFFPLDQIHPNARFKASYVLDAEDKEAAYEQVMSGEVSEKDLPNEETALLAEHRDIARSLGVRGTPSFWVNGTLVSGADTAKLDKLLQDQQHIN